MSGADRSCSVADIPPRNAALLVPPLPYANPWRHSFDYDHRMRKAKGYQPWKGGKTALNTLEMAHHGLGRFGLEGLRHVWFTKQLNHSHLVHP